MTYPLIDITRPVRLTEYGIKIFAEKMSQNGSSVSKIICEAVDEKLTHRVSLDGNNWMGITKSGTVSKENYPPIVENIPLEDTKTESKMTVDWTKEVIDLETGEVMRVLCTDRPGSPGDGVILMDAKGILWPCRIDGNVGTKKWYGNRKPDTEPPEEIFKVWCDGYSKAIGFYPNRSMAMSKFIESESYHNYKNKKITVEDV